MLLLLYQRTKSCVPASLIVADSVLAFVDGAIAALAFFQLLRIYLRNQQLGWTRQMIFHLMIGLSKTGYLMYFISPLLATCEGWHCWLHGCGFVLMASPQILFLAAFLLLLSFWVDLCHQAKDDEEEDENGITESLLEKPPIKMGPLHLDGRRRCCSFRNIHVGSRQKVVLLAILLVFVLMIVFALLIWEGRDKEPINSSLVAKIYQDIFSIVMLLLGGAFACYGFLLFSKMSKVRSEMASTEMWKVTSLAAVTLVCFTSCSILALVTNAPVLSYRHSDHPNRILTSVFIFLYFFIGSSVPCAVVLWIMREMPPPVAPDRRPQSRVVTFLRETRPDVNNPQWRATVASSHNKALKVSPI